MVHSGMVAVIARQTERLTSMNLWKTTHDSNQLPLSWGLEPSNGIASVLCMKGNAFDDAL